AGFRVRLVQKRKHHSKALLPSGSPFLEDRNKDPCLGQSTLLRYGRSKGRNRLSCLKQHGHLSRCSSRINASRVDVPSRQPCLRAKNISFQFQALQKKSSV